MPPAVSEELQRSSRYVSLEISLRHGAASSLRGTIGSIAGKLRARNNLTFHGCATYKANELWRDGVRASRLIYAANGARLSA